MITNSKYRARKLARNSFQLFCGLKERVVSCVRARSGSIWALLSVVINVPDYRGPTSAKANTRRAGAILRFSHREPRAGRLAGNQAVPPRASPAHAGRLTHAAHDEWAFVSERSVRDQAKIQE